MRIPRIFHDNALSVGQEYALPEPAARHVTRVLRLAVGSELILFNGDGNEYAARLSRVERHHAWAQINSCTAVDRESPLQLTLAQALAKGERMDFALQKAVELGVTTICLLYTERSISPLTADRLPRKLLHWQGVITSACEQCGRTRLPQLLPPIAIQDWLEQIDTDTRLVLDPTADTDFSSVNRPADNLSLLNGPEGGLTNDEIALACQHGFTAIRFGPRIMRTETAALAVLAACQHRWGDLG